MSQSDLGNLLAKVLPSNVKVTIRHISSTPTPCAALFAAPPGQAPEATFCENHFLALSVNAYGKDGQEEQEVIVFGIEVLVYSTAHLTTVFVSKADSTGYLHLLKTAPKVSIIRLVSTAFLSYLVETRQRPGVRLVLSLFARAQNQYLFPGSIENEGKHVLDDRGLIKWWCRVVDPILREREPESIPQDKGPLDQTTESAKSSATAFLIVPGCDKFETRGFFPSTAKFDDNKDHPRWVNSYPLRQLCGVPNAPPRCLVPRFPDDPKTRFLVDLDDELSRYQIDTGGDVKNSGQWRSVKSLDQFWEMMSFRQECSAGRLVGFLWLVVNPPGLVNSTCMIPASSSSGDETGQPSLRQATSTFERVSSDLRQDNNTPASASQSQSSSSSSDRHYQYPFFWPEAGRGHVVLSEGDYKAAIDFLLRQEFETYDLAIASTKVWIDKVASLADQLWWGEFVTGRNTVSEDMAKPLEANNLMDVGLIRKRKKPAEEDVFKTADVEEEGSKGQQPSLATDMKDKAEAVSSQASGVNVLNGSFIRKKKKKET